MDSVILGHVEALEPIALMDALEREPRHACGGGPMVPCCMPHDGSAHATRASSATPIPATSQATRHRWSVIWRRR
jgi:hypothetical protein